MHYKRISEEPSEMNTKVKGGWVGGGGESGGWGGCSRRGSWEESPGRKEGEEQVKHTRNPREAHRLLGEPSLRKLSEGDGPGGCYFHA